MQAEYVDGSLLLDTAEFVMLIGHSTRRCFRNDLLIAFGVTRWGSALCFNCTRLLLEIKQLPVHL